MTMNAIAQGMVVGFLAGLIAGSVVVNWRWAMAAQQGRKVESFGAKYWVMRARDE
jgi:hypothetical protein